MVATAFRGAGAADLLVGGLVLAGALMPVVRADTTRAIRDFGVAAVGLIIMSVMLAHGVALAAERGQTGVLLVAAVCLGCAGSDVGRVHRRQAVRDRPLAPTLSPSQDPRRAHRQRPRGRPRHRCPRARPVLDRRPAPAPGPRGDRRVRVGLGRPPRVGREARVRREGRRHVAAGSAGSSTGSTRCCSRCRSPTGRCGSSTRRSPDMTAWQLSRAAGVGRDRPSPRRPGPRRVRRRTADRGPGMASTCPRPLLICPNHQSHFDIPVLRRASVVMAGIASPSRPPTTTGSSDRPIGSSCRGSRPFRSAGSAGAPRPCEPSRPSSTKAGGSSSSPRGPGAGPGRSARSRRASDSSPPTAGSRSSPSGSTVCGRSCRPAAADRGGGGPLSLRPAPPPGRR